MTAKTSRVVTAAGCLALSLTGYAQPPGCASCEFGGNESPSIQICTEMCESGSVECDVWNDPGSDAGIGSVTV